jgi:hypothetical protein
VREEMRADVRGERLEAAVSLLLGLAAVALAVGLWRAASPYAAAGVPLLVLGLPQLASGAVHLGAAARRRDALGPLLAQDPGRFQHREIARVGRMLTQLRFSVAGETLLLLAGAGVAVLFRGSTAGLGVGAALAAEGLALLAMDGWSRARARRYLDHLERFLTDAGARPTTAETGDVAHE